MTRRNSTKLQIYINTMYRIPETYDLREITAAVSAQSMETITSKNKGNTNYIQQKTFDKRTFLSVKDEVRYQMIPSLNNFWKIPCLQKMKLKL